MATDGITGLATTIAATTIGTIGLVHSISFDGYKVDVIDTSSASSTSAFKTAAAGLIEPGEMTVEVLYDGAVAGVQKALDTHFVTQANETFTITFTDTSTLACSGYISSVSIGAPHDGAVTSSITVKLSGVITYTDVV